MTVPGRMLQVYCLDVGQGDCTFVLPPDNKPPVLFDCKDAHVARMFVRHAPRPIPEISAVVFSHLDDDHIAGGEQFIKDYLAEGGSIRYVYLDADRDLSKRSRGSKTAKGLVDFVKDLARQRKIELLAPRADPAEVDRSSHPRDWSVRIVGPRQEALLDVARSEIANEPNVYSAVLRVNFAGKTVIIGGDAPLASWAQIRREDISAAAFRIPHHGGALDDGDIPAGWTAHRLYGDVGPSLGIISVGTRNGYEHPRSDWVRPLLARANCSTICTQLTPRCEPRVATHDGALVYRARIINHAEDALAAWRHRPDRRALTDNPPRAEVPCAGTIAIVLREDGQLERFPEEHGSGHTTHVLPMIPGAWCLRAPS